MLPTRGLSWDWPYLVEEVAGPPIRMAALWVCPPTCRRRGFDSAPEACAHVLPSRAWEEVAGNDPDYVGKGFALPRGRRRSRAISSARAKGLPSRVREVARASY